MNKTQYAQALFTVLRNKQLLAAADGDGRLGVGTDVLEAMEAANVDPKMLNSYGLGNLVGDRGATLHLGEITAAAQAEDPKTPNASAVRASQRSGGTVFQFRR